jgi:hypothetical protein
MRSGNTTCSPTVNVPSGDYLRLAKQGPEFQKMSSGSVAVDVFIAGDLFVRREIPWLNQYTPGWRASTGGTPEAYYERMDGGQRLFGLVPPPSIGSSEVGKVILPYVAKPQTMSA